MDVRQRRAHGTLQRWAPRLPQPRPLAAAAPLRPWFRGLESAKRFLDDSVRRRELPCETAPGRTPPLRISLQRAPPVAAREICASTAKGRSAQPEGNRPPSAPKQYFQPVPDHRLAGNPRVLD